MDRRFIRRYLGFDPVYNSSDDCTDACIWGTVGSSDGVFSFPFLARFWPFVLVFLHGVFLHPWDLEMSTKTCSNNMVSSNDHVVMNHQNQTPNKWHMRSCSLQKGCPYTTFWNLEMLCGGNYFCTMQFMASMLVSAAHRTSFNSANCHYSPVTSKLVILIRI
jgi:hypothetical protein